MNIHLPAILGFTRYQGFDPSPWLEMMGYITGPIWPAKNRDWAINQWSDSKPDFKVCLKVGVEGGQKKTEA